MQIRNCLFPRPEEQVDKQNQKSYKGKNKESEIKIRRKFMFKKIIRMESPKAPENCTNPLY